MMKELVKVIELESYQYQDPVTEFVEALYCRVDFEGMCLLFMFAGLPVFSARCW